ncbi:MAG: hypothetical protein IH840_04385 [Candidatus Heimdallarchaeota archaeon]|nr:hypothetical protein [Candidatus Heimdallarchaeota archaeon]
MKISKIIDFKSILTLFLVFQITMALNGYSSDRDISSSIALNPQSQEKLSRQRSLGEGLERDSGEYNDIKSIRKTQNKLSNIQIQSNHKILLLHAEVDTTIVDRIEALLTPHGITADRIGIAYATPSLTDLVSYPLVFVWTDLPPQDPITTGNVLADYVDSGGSVIMAEFAHSDSFWDIQGRFFSDGYSAFIKNGIRDIIRVYDGLSTHPIFENVLSFTPLFPTEPVSLRSDATLVASYIDGVPLVGVKNAVVSISAWMDPIQWNGNGDLILVNSINYLLSQKVLLLHSDSSSFANDFADLILPFGYRVDQINIATSTPTLQEIEDYQIMITWTSNTPPTDPNGYGDLLADYVDRGGYVILMPLTYFDSIRSIGGRFNSSAYGPFVQSLDINVVKSYTGDLNHPIFKNVSGYNTSSAVHANLTSNSFIIERYDDGTPFLVLKGSVLAINSYVPANTGGDINLILRNSLEFLLTNITMDNSSPQIVNQIDFIPGDSGSSFVISWVLTDDDPYFFDLIQNNVSINSGSWSSGQSILVSLNESAIGLNVFEMIAIDTIGNTQIDHVKFVIGNTGPPVILSSSLDSSYELGMVGNQLLWTVGDSDPDYYEIYQNETMVDTGSWASNIPITWNIENLTLGVYNFTLTVFDEAGNSIIDSITIEIQDTLVPEIKSQHVLVVEENSSGNTLIWELNDVDPNQYTVFLDGLQIEQGLWSDGELITFNTDGLSIGTYNYSILVSDGSGNTAQDTIFVSVQDSTAPEISAPSDIDIRINEFGINVTWIVDDAHPSTYLVTRNGASFAKGLWESSSILSFSLDDLTIGTHIMEIIVSDIYENVNSDEVIVTIKDTGVPVMSTPPDLFFFEGEEGNVINWLVGDDDPTFFTLEENLTLNDLLINTSWVFLDFIQLDLNEFRSGQYAFTLTLHDASNNTISDTVNVQIYPVNPFRPSSNTTSTSNFFRDIDPNIIVGTGVVIGITVLGYGIIRRRG